MKSSLLLPSYWWVDQGLISKCVSLFLFLSLLISPVEPGSVTQEAEVVLKAGAL